ncbi:MAG: hypothetical protein V7707_08170 [Motiliproteus sp.]
MDWSRITGVIAKAAPLLGTALGGPAGAAVGAMVAQSLGVEATPEAIEQHLAQNPEALVELKTLEHDERKHLRDLAFKRAQLDVESDRMALTDVQNARDQHKDHWMPAALTAALFVAFSALATALFFAAIPEGNRDLVVYLAGQLTGATMTAIAYWLGSSRGSKEKEKAKPVAGYG